MPRIKEYHRPQTLEEALKLLQGDQAALPLAGGTELIPSGDVQARSVVDLQALGLDQLSTEGFHLHIGAAVSLQRLVESPLAGQLLAEAAHL